MYRVSSFLGAHAKLVWGGGGGAKTLLLGVYGNAAYVSNCIHVRCIFYRAGKIHMTADHDI